MEEKTNEIIIESSDDDLAFLSLDSEVSVQKVEQDGFIPMTIDGEERDGFQRRSDPGAGRFGGGPETSRYVYRVYVVGRAASLCV